MNIKITLVVFFVFLLAGCKLLESGGEGSPRGITADLSNLKGPMSEPGNEVLDFFDGREVFINSQISGVFGAVGNVHIFTFRPQNSQLVSVSISDHLGRSETIDVSVNDPSLDYDETVISSDTYTANSFFAIAGKTHEVNVHTNDSGSYTVKLADANRETMQLSEHEFYVHMTKTSETQCNGVVSNYNPVNVYYTFNFRDASFIESRNVEIQFDLIDDFTIGQSGSSTYEGENILRGHYRNTIESTFAFTLDPDNGGVSGEYQHESITIYDDQRFETRVCFTTDRFEGQIVL